MARSSGNQTTPGVIVATIAILGLGVVGIYVVASFAIQGAAFAASSLSKWGAEVDAEIMAVIVSILLTYTFTQLNQMRKQRNQINPKKVEIYQDVVYHLSLHPFSPEQAGQQPSKELNAEVNRLAAQLITHGSNDVLVSFKKWRIAREEMDANSSLVAVGDVLLAIRKDLKLRNTGINTTDLVRCITRAG